MVSDGETKGATRVTMYHIACGNYEAGQPLKPYNLQDDDERGEWRWSDAPEGTHCDHVCLYPTLEAALDALASVPEFDGGILLAVELEWDGEDRFAYGDHLNGGCIPVTVNEEGFPMVAGIVPADLLSPVAVESK